MKKSKIRSKIIRNFRGVSCTILLILLLGIGGCQSDDAAPPIFANLRVFVDYKDLSANDDAQVFSSGATYGEYKGDILMLPFYPIAQRLGYAVFDGTVTKPGEIISVRTGYESASINGVALPPMTVAPYLSGEELMVPADFLSDAFGVRIEKIFLEEVREPSTRFDAVMIHTFEKPTPQAKARVFDMANEYLFTYVPGMRQGERLTSSDVSSLHTNLLVYAFYYDFFNDTDTLFDWADDPGDPAKGEKPYLAAIHRNEVDSIARLFFGISDIVHPIQTDGSGLEVVGDWYQVIPGEYTPYSMIDTLGVVAREEDGLNIYEVLVTDYPYEMYSYFTREDYYGDYDHFSEFMHYVVEMTGEEIWAGMSMKDAARYAIVHGDLMPFALDRRGSDYVLRVKYTIGNSGSDYAGCLRFLESETIPFPYRMVTEE